MKITNIRASVHEYPVMLPQFEEPVDVRQSVFCEVETDDGTLGWGVTTPTLGHSITSALTNYILPAVRGMDPRNIEAIHAKVASSLNPRAYTGTISHALSAFDVACWDIHGKSADRSVAELMGGHRDWAPAYVTFGYPQLDVDQLVEFAQDWISRGFRGLKMVVGHAPGGWREDAARIRAVRDAIGFDIDLMADANFAFSPHEAKMLCRAIEDCNLTWFEEPLYQNDARALSDLRRNTSVPLSAGQMEGHRWRARELVEHHAVDVIQPNCCYNGGYTETRKIAHLAQAYNLRVANGGGWPIFNVHTMAGLMNGWYVEFHMGMWQAGRHFFVNVPEPSEGVIRVPKKPGLGFEPNRDVLRDSLVHPA